MSDAIIHDWLLPLCDPEGHGRLPLRTLCMAQVVDLLELAWEHGVAGAVVANLGTLLEREGSQRLLDPREVRGKSRHVASAVSDTKWKWLNFVAVSMFLRSRTAELQDAAERLGLPSAIIKGEDFADRLYPRSSLRPFRDIDLLLPRAAAVALGPVMSRWGYAALAVVQKHDEGYGQEVWESTAGASVSVELHWNLINSPSQRRRSSVVFEDLQFEAAAEVGLKRRLSPASMLLVATVHAVLGHRFDRLQHLCDIRQICRGAAGEIDVDWLREAARRTGTSTSVGMGLEVTERLLGVPQCRHLRRRLQLGSNHVVSRLLVRQETLLAPYTRVSKLRRQALRELVKRAA
jgi:hypothetical protein